jgi:hypothetical protein
VRPGPVRHGRVDAHQERARIAEEKVAILTAENDRLAHENASLRAQLTGDSAQSSTETECQTEALRKALIEVLAD